MAGLQKEGKVRWIGVSNFTVAQIERAEKIAPVISLQPPYSLIHRQIETETLPYCEKQGIGVIVYSPMASGLLTGAMTRERAAKLPDDDWRKNSPEFREPSLSKNLKLVERLRKVAARNERTPGEVAVAWTLRLPAITGAIVGARNARQAEGVMRAGELELTPQDIAEIEGTTAAHAGRQFSKTIGDKMDLGLRGKAAVVSGLREALYQVSLITTDRPTLLFRWR